MIDLYGLAWRRDDNSHLAGWNGDGEGGACGDIRNGDRWGDQRDRGRIRNLRRRGVGHERAGGGGSAGKRAACIHCAVRSGKAPVHAFVLRIILNCGGEILGLVNRECLGLWRNAYADDRSGRGGGGGRPGGGGRGRGGGGGGEEGRGGRGFVCRGGTGRGAPKAVG